MTINLTTFASAANLSSIVLLGGSLYAYNGVDGKLYMYNGSAWVAKSGVFNAGLPSVKLIVTNGLIYGIAIGFSITLTNSFKVWDGISAWTNLDITGSFGGTVSLPLDICAHNNEPCFSVKNAITQNYSVYKWSAGALQLVVTSFADFGTTPGTYTCFIVSFGGTLYLINDSGTLFSSANPPVALTAAAHSTQGSGSSALLGQDPPWIVFGGELYYATRITGALQLGSIFKWNGVNAWTSLVPYDATKLPVAMLNTFGGSIYMTNGGTKIWQYDGVVSLMLVCTKAGVGLVQSVINGASTYVRDGTGSQVLYSMAVGSNFTDAQIPVFLPGF